jgi:Protein of unknown function (DUF4238)
MSVDSTLINSHIIPAFYLEQFAMPSIRGKDKPGRLWVYERDKEPDERATSVQGREKGYFGFINSDGTLEESFEQTLADRENECNEVLVCAKSHLFHWPRGSREKLAFYAALLYRRATQSRSFAGNNWEKILQELRQSATDNQLVKELAECLGKRLNTPVSTEAMQNAILEWIKQAQTPAAATNSFLSDLLEMTEYIASLLLKKEPWRILRPPDGEQFVTTDNPLITFVPIGNGLLHPGYGFRKEEAVAAFPLAPEACLVMGNAWSVPTTLDIGSLTSLNETLITICDRYTYSKTLSEQIQETVQKRAGICRYGVNALMPTGLNMPTAKQFLWMKFCADVNN